MQTKRKSTHNTYMHSKYIYALRTLHNNHNHLIIFYRNMYNLSVCVCVCSIVKFSNRLFNTQKWRTERYELYRKLIHRTFIPSLKIIIKFGYRIQSYTQAYTHLIRTRVFVLPTKISIHNISMRKRGGKPKLMRFKNTSYGRSSSVHEFYEFHPRNTRVYLSIHVRR